MRRVLALSVVAAWLASLAPIAAQAAPATPLHGHSATAKHIHRVEPAVAGAPVAGTAAGHTATAQPAAAAPATNLPVTGGSWQELGPKPETGGFSTGMTGRVLTLAKTGISVTPSTPLFAGSAGGGVWKSTDGSSWSVAGNFDTMPSLAIDAIGIDPLTLGGPVSGLHILAGSGEVANAIDAQNGSGIYLSTDGGATWTLEGTSLLNNYAVSSFAFEGPPGNRIYAGIAAKGSSTNAGVAFSTDGGVTWNLTGLTGHSVTDLAIDSTQHVFAAVGDGSASDGIWTSSDRGASFGQVKVDGSANQLWWKVALADPNTAFGSQTVYALEASSSSGTGAVMKVWKSTSSGSSWSDVTNGLDSNDYNSGPGQGVNPGQSWYDLWLATGPGSTSTVYVGTTDIFKSTNGGASWNNQTNIYGGPTHNQSLAVNGFHPDQHAVVFMDPSNAFVGNDGGVQKTTDGMVSFATANTGLGTAQFYGGDVSSNEQVIFGGLQDNGNPLSIDAGANWNDWTSGDGYYTAIDPNNTANLYSEGAFGGLELSTSGGSFTSFSNPFDPSNGTDGNSSFIAPLTLSGGTLYSGRHRLWSSSNPCASACGPGNFVGHYVSSNGSVGGDLLASSSFILTISVAGSTIFVTDRYGNLFASTDGGNTWANRNGGASTCTPVPYFCRSGLNLASNVTADTATIAYETVGGKTGVAGKHVFRTGDGGSSWQDISTSLPDVGFNQVMIDPTTHTTIYAASDAGVFTSTDSGSTWSTVGTGLPNAKVDRLVRKGTNLYAFTHGRGLWKVSTTAGAPPAAPTGLVVTSTGFFENDLAWSPSSGASSYNVKRSNVSGSGYSTIASGVSATTYRDPGAHPGITSYYVVTASNGAESAPSAEASGAPAALVSTVVSQIQNKSYPLTTGNDGGFGSWVAVDSALDQVLTPTSSGTAVVTGNIDLWTALAGFNQDIGVFANDNGAGDTLIAWKESGGFAGTYSPNAAFVQALLPVVAGHTYTFKLKWKPNKAAPPSTIYAGAGTAQTQFSPTRLTVRLVPSAAIFSAVQNQSYHIAGFNDGGFGSWVPVDSNLDVTVPGADTSVQVSANMDLWTASAGFNQDIGLFVSDNGGADSLIAWKESGGFAGILSPNAAFVTTSYATQAGHSYTFRLKWKPNKPAPGGTVYGAAGTASTQFSPTRVTVEQMAPGSFSFGTQNQSYHLDSANNGGFGSWVELSPADRAQITPAAGSNAVVTGNMDLWTTTAGFNQDIGIFLCDSSLADCSLFGNYSLVAWKESGGFAGTLSPNAATVQASTALTGGHQYTFALGWKPNKAAPGGVVYGAAGTSTTQFSPTNLLVQLGG